MSRYVNRMSHGSHEGLDVSYVKSRKTIVIGGWYDGFVGIEQWEIPLAEFLTQLGITEADIHRALKEPLSALTSAQPSTSERTTRVQ